MKNLYTVFLCILALITNTTQAQQIQNATQKSTLKVTGKGEVKVKPDVAYLRLSVETTSPRASEAVYQNAEKMEKVIDKLGSLIGKEDEISTTGYNLSPVYQYDEKTRRSVLTGYRVLNQVEIETSRLNDIGKLIDSAIQSGVNRVESVRFDTRKKSDYKKQALVKAVNEAREIAEIVASASGVKIVKVLRISPSYESPIPVYKEITPARGIPSEITTPIEPGEVTIQASVSILFEID
ncbi:MAG: putative conserved lipoprotein LpqG [Deltaproteobacteria bacterium]|nr:MAG: putative conserved lipoprotein LpqG [Deltaproteobacteria bacterium]